MFQSFPRALVGALLLSAAAHLALFVGAPWEPRLSFGLARANDASGRLGARLQMAAAGRTVSADGVGDEGGTGVRRKALPPLPEGGRSEAMSRRALPRGRATASAAPETIAPGGLSADRTDGLAAEDVRTYRFNLALAARQWAGRQGGRQGRVDVSVTQRGGRALAEVAVHRSSGMPALDREAVAMMTRAVALADLPRGMSGRDFRLVLPLLFGAAE